jgi:hypothetical protein
MDSLLLSSPPHTILMISPVFHQVRMYSSQISPPVQASFTVSSMHQVRMYSLQIPSLPRTVLATSSIPHPSQNASLADISTDSTHPHYLVDSSNQNVFLADNSTGLSRLTDSPPSHKTILTSNLTTSDHPNLPYSLHTTIPKWDPLNISTVAIAMAQTIY